MSKSSRLSFDRSRHRAWNDVAAWFPHEVIEEVIPPEVDLVDYGRLVNMVGSCMGFNHVEVEAAERDRKNFAHSVSVHGIRHPRFNAARAILPEEPVVGPVCVCHTKELTPREINAAIKGCVKSGLITFPIRLQSRLSAASVS